MLSKGMNLPDNDEVMRFVPWQRLRRDEDDNVIGVLPQAYELRQDERGLSVNWLGYFEGDREARIAQSVVIFRATRSVGKKSAFAIGAVSRVKEVGRSRGIVLKLVYTPERDNQSHSEVRQIPADDIVLLEAFASEAFEKLVKNSDVA